MPVADPSARKRIVLCADDFGFTDPGCQAVIELAGAKAISAASCVVDGPSTASYAAALRAAASDASLGLHFNLTEPAGAPMRAGLCAWLWRTHVLRAIDVSALRTELRRQLCLFEDLFARAPAYVDGHEHVHQLPGIAAMLVEELVNRYGAACIAVRSTVPKRWCGVKAQSIALLGGTGLQVLLRGRHVPSNSDFAGAYDFSLRVPYQRRMQSWLASIADGGLIMCHPERPAVLSSHLSLTSPGSSGSSEVSGLSRATARHAEYAFLASNRWPALLRQCGAELVPFGRGPLDRPGTTQDGVGKQERLA